MNLGFDKRRVGPPRIDCVPPFAERLNRFGDRVASMLNKGRFEVIDRNRDEARAWDDETSGRDQRGWMHFRVVLGCEFRGKRVVHSYIAQYYETRHLNLMKPEDQDRWIVNRLNEMLTSISTLIQTKDPPKRG